MSSLSKEVKTYRDFYESTVWEFRDVTNIYERIRLEEIFRFLNPRPTDVVLDAGCGGGTYTRFIAELSTVVAVDISRKAVENAKKMLSGFSDHIHFLVCDGGHLPIKNNIIDEIMSIDVLEHVPGAKSSLREMQRVSKSGTKVLIFTACGENKFTLEYILHPVLGRLIDSIRQKLGHIHIFTTPELRGLLKPYFVVNKIRYMHHWLAWSVKFMWDISNLKSEEGHSRSPTFQNPVLSMFSNVLWKALEAEAKLFKNNSSGSEIIINATAKETAAPPGAI